MLTATVLGDSVEDLVATLAKIPVVGSEAASRARSAFALIRSEATKGAKAAIPEITAAVRTEAEKVIKAKVRPLLIASLVVGSVALATAVGSVIVARR